MRIKLKELPALVESIIAEAKKKKDKEKKLSKVPEPKEYQYAEAFDYSPPLAAYNLYRSQGQANWGPQTGEGPRVDDRTAIHHTLKEDEKVLNGIVEGTLIPEKSAWDAIKAVKEDKSTLKGFLPESTAWGEALRWYDHAGQGLGTPGALEEKAMGFAKLKGKLAHKKGVKNPAALAASIGRKKLGNKEMARRAAAGKK